MQYSGSASANLAPSAASAISFAQFNTIGGLDQTLVLTGVRITALRTLTGAINVESASGNTRNGAISYEMTSRLQSGSLFNLTDTAGSPSLAFAVSGFSTVNVNTGQAALQASNVFNAATLAPYVGSGSISVTHSISNFISTLVLDGGGQGNLRGNSNGSVSGSVQVEYFFNDPIPEPSAWAMLIVGFGLTGATLRRQRALRLA